MNDFQKWMFNHELGVPSFSDHADLFMAITSVTQCRNIGNFFEKLLEIRINKNWAVEIPLGGSGVRDDINDRAWFSHPCHLWVQKLQTNSFA